MISEGSSLCSGGERVQTFAAGAYGNDGWAQKRRPERRMMRQSGSHLMFMPWRIFEDEGRRRALNLVRNEHTHTTMLNACKAIDPSTRPRNPIGGAYAFSEHHERRP